MNDPSIVDYWMEKALDDLASAWDNHTAGRYQNAVRDAYFACFHSFSSVLIDQGKKFKKHKEVRSILHRDFIRTQRMDPSWGKHYDWLFDNRHKADYRPLVQFEPDQVMSVIEGTQAFVDQMNDFLARSRS
jgi:uncharacterized protein (UPF0332 family)